MGTHAWSFTRTRRVLPPFGWNAARRRRVHYGKSQFVFRIGNRITARMWTARDGDLRLDRGGRVSKSFGIATAANACVRARPADEWRRGSQAIGGTRRQFSQAALRPLRAITGDCGRERCCVASAEAAGSPPWHRIGLRHRRRRGRTACVGYGSPQEPESDSI